MAGETCDRHDDCLGRIHDKLDTVLNQNTKTVTLVEANIQKTDEFMKKVDDQIFHVNDGFVVKFKTKLSGICARVNAQWAILIIMVGGIIGVAFYVIKAVASMKIP